MSSSVAGAQVPAGGAGAAPPPSPVTPSSTASLPPVPPPAAPAGAAPAAVAPARTAPAAAVNDPHDYPPGYYPGVYAPTPDPTCNGTPLQLLPWSLPYERGAQIPPCYHPMMRQRLGFFIAGGVVFGLAYGVALSAAPADRQLSPLYVPLVGPLVASAQVAASGDEPLGFNSDLLSAIAFFQLTGAGLAGLGALLRREILIRDDLHPRPPTLSPSSATMTASARRGLGADFTWRVLVVPRGDRAELRVVGAF